MHCDERNKCQLTGVSPPTCQKRVDSGFSLNAPATCFDGTRYDLAVCNLIHARLVRRHVQLQWLHHQMHDRAMRSADDRQARDMLVMCCRLKSNQPVMLTPTPVPPVTPHPQWPNKVPILIDRCVFEEETNTLAVVGTSAGFGELSKIRVHPRIEYRVTYRRTNVNGLNAVAKLLLVLMGYRVGDDNLLELAAIERFDGVAAQNTVGDDGECILCTLGDEDVSCFDKSTTCVGHVVDQDGCFASNISDQHHS